MLQHVVTMTTDPVLRTREVMFSQVSVSPRGVPHFLVPGPFWGAPQSLVPCLFQGQDRVLPPTQDRLHPQTG